MSIEIINQCTECLDTRFNTKVDGRDLPDPQNAIIICQQLASCIHQAEDTESSEPSTGPRGRKQNNSEGRAGIMTASQTVFVLSLLMRETQAFQSRKPDQQIEQHVPAPSWTS